MSGSKALSRDESQQVRLLVNLVLDSQFGGAGTKGSQTRMAKATGVRQSVISEAASAGRKGGVKLLRALAKFKPVEVLKILGVSPAALLAVWVESSKGAEELANVDGLPDSLRRAARAAIELYGCSADEAKAAVVAARLSEDGLDDETPADVWVMRLPKYLPTRKKSGVRPKV